MTHSLRRRFSPTFKVTSELTSIRRKLRQRLTDIHGLLDKLDSFMLSVNEV